MGQKVHPKGFRLGFTQDHLSNWYASPKDYAQYVIQDNELRQKLTLEGVSKIEIRRVPGQIRVWLYTSQQKQVFSKYSGPAELPSLDANRKTGEHTRMLLGRWSLDCLSQHG